MAFKNIRMNEKELAWEKTLGMKDPSLNYKRDLDRRPDGPYMTADRERKMYLLSIMSDGDPREGPTDKTPHYFYFMWDGGCLYFAANLKTKYDKEGDYAAFIWKIRSMDLFENKQGLSKEQIQALVSEALAEYGEDGLDEPDAPGVADFSKTTFSEK